MGCNGVFWPRVALHGARRDERACPTGLSPGKRQAAEGDSHERGNRGVQDAAGGARGKESGNIGGGCNGY